MFEERTQKLKACLVEDGLEMALITDDDSVYYFSGFYDYLHTVSYTHLTLPTT